MDEKPSNVSKGRNSFDARIGDKLVAFFNRNASEYPTEVGAPAFDLIPVEKKKDIMVNVARLHAQQEYDRIMELVAVLQKQAGQLKRRLELTDLVHAAKYQFQLANGQCYWLVYDEKNDGTLLTGLGPNDWFTGSPDYYRYLTRVKWLGDYTWIEVDEDGQPIHNS
jgi:hypothetical protein